MAIFWQDLTAHRWHWFILIYFLWLEHVAYTRDLTAFCREQYNSVWSYSYVIPQIFTSWDFATGGWRTNAFSDRLTVYLIPSVSIPGLSWLFGFGLSHFVGIPIFGNTLWYVFTLLLRSNCWGCKGILDLIEQTWIFHTNHIKRVSMIWKSL